MEKTDNEINWDPLGLRTQKSSSEVVSTLFGIWQKWSSIGLVVPGREEYSGPLWIWVCAATFSSSQGQVYPSTDIS